MYKYCMHFTVTLTGVPSSDLRLFLLHALGCFPSQCVLLQHCPIEFITSRPWESPTLRGGCHRTAGDRCLMQIFEPTAIFMLRNFILTMSVQVYVSVMQILGYRISTKLLCYNILYSVVFILWICILYNVL